MIDEETIRSQVVTYAQRAYDRRLVGGTGGNVSARLSGGRMVITASGVSLGDTELENLISVRLADYTWEPVDDFVPSKEFRFHVGILRIRPDVNAIVHVHPPYATSFAVKGQDIPRMTDAGFKLPPMPCVPFAPGGSEELVQYVIRAVEENPDCKVILLEKHGIVALGTDVVNAYNLADLTEELAQIAIHTNR